jgi:hypothetical protein
VARVAEKISDDEAEGKTPRDERRGLMDRSLGEAPLQDHDCIEMDRDLKERESVADYCDSVIRPKLIQWNPAKKRTAPERDAYAGAKRVGNVIKFPTVEPPKPKKHRRRKPWSPMDKNDIPDPKFDPKENKRLEIVKRRVPDPFSKTGAYIEVDANLIGDQLVRMLGWRQITNLQFDTGRKLEQLFDETELGDLRAADTTRDIVDCARPAHEWCNADRVDKINFFRKWLKQLLFDKQRATYLWWIVRDGIPIKHVATHMGCKDHKPILREFKIGLDELTEYFDSIGKPDPWQRFAA